MTTVKNLTGSGIAPGAALAIGGLPTSTFVANGSGVQTGNTLPSDFVIVSSATSGFYCQLPTAATQNPTVGDEYTIVNYSSQTINISTTAAGKLNNGSAGAAYAVANGLTATARYLGSDNWSMQKGA